MQQLILNASEEIAEYIRRKGFAEIFVRTVQARCSEIAKCAVSVAPDKAGEIANIASHAMKGLGISNHNLTAFKNDIIRQINPAGIRRELVNLSRNQAKNSALLQSMAGNVSNIYSKVSCVQELSWLNVALSAANLAVTVISTVVICRKLDEISNQLAIIDNKVDSIKRVQFESIISKPCRELIRDYKEILDDLDDGKEVSKKRMVDTIKACCSQIETLYNLRAEYNLNDILLLIYDLLPVYMALIIMLYQYYYDPMKPKYILHDNWMDVFDTLTSEAFRNEIRDYYFIVERKHNDEVNQIVDSQYLVTIGMKHKVEQALLDLAECDSAKDCRDINIFCERYALQQAKVMEAEMKDKFGEEETAKMLEPVKMIYMQSEAS